MAKSIVYLMPVPLTDHYARRYGLRVLENKGIKPYIIDLSKLINREVSFRDYDESLVQKNRIFQISSYAQLDEKIKDLSKTAVFVDYLVGLSGIDMKHKKVFRILKKYGAPYYVISDGDLTVPFLKSDSKKNEFLKRFDARRTGYYVTKIMLRFLIKLGFYPLPVKVFGTDSENLRKYMKKHDNGTIHHVPINAFDYSVYLEYVKNNQKASRDSEKSCVFLDEDIVYSSDLDFSGYNKIKGENYFNAMNRLFKKIEEETGLKVIIAAHPMSHYEEHPDAFGGRKIIKNQTVELVAQSSLVILHSSTAVSYPVLFNKPVLVVKTDDMIHKQAQRTHYIDAFADQLGTTAINIDDKKQMEALDLKTVLSSRNNYDSYKYKYLVTRGIEDLSTWDVIAEQLHKEPQNG